jgi:hypothetical protein
MCEEDAWDVSRLFGGSRGGRVSDNQSTACKEMYLIKVDLDTADVGRANGDHAEETISPSAKHYRKGASAIVATCFNEVHLQATRSFNTKRSLSLFAIYGETEKRSPKFSRMISFAPRAHSENISYP